MFKETLVLSTIIFVISLFLCYLPSKIKSVQLLKRIYPYITIAAAGFMLAMLLMDFIPHLTGTCIHKHKHKKNHTFDECPDALMCDIHKAEILSAKKKSHDHSAHHHDAHTHKHTEFSFFTKNFGFFIAGVSFIFLLGIDSLLLQHSHCDNEDVVYMNDGINHGPHQHEYCHMHGDIQHIANDQESNSMENPIEKTVEIEKEYQKDDCPHIHGSDCKNSHTHDPNIQKRNNKKSGTSHACTETKINIKSNEKAHFHLDGSCNTSALKDKKDKLQAMIFIIALSIHSLFEGFAIKTNEIGIFELGIVLHKALESFALGFTVWMAAFSYNYKLILMTIYSLLTPIGMFISFFLQKLAFGKSSQKIQHLLKATCNGLALGSILFIVCVEMIPPNFHSKGANLTKIITLCTGYLSTCMVIYFIH